MHRNLNAPIQREEIRRRVLSKLQRLPHQHLRTTSPIRTALVPSIREKSIRNERENGLSVLEIHQRYPNRNRLDQDRIQAERHHEDDHWVSRCDDIDTRCD